MPTKLENARNSAKFGFLGFLLSSLMMRRKLTRHFFRDEVLTSRLALEQRRKLRKTKERDSRCFV